MPYKVAKTASKMDSIDLSAWQRGCIDGAAWINRRNNAFGLVCFLVGGAVGGKLLSASSLWAGAIGGVVAWMLVNLLIYGGHTAFAYKRQRDEARVYAGSLEAHAHDYGQWARRREIAYDFRHEILLGEVPRISDPEGLIGSVSDEEDRWRINVAAVRAQLIDQGASESVANLIDTQLAALGPDEDSDEIRRIRQSMMATCQNLWGEVVRQQPAPPVPAPPAVEKISDAE